MITFHTPPGWPDPPEGYLPWHGWRPDPSWPPAPPGFQFYRDGYGYPTPPPPEYWQPWTSTDWSATGQQVGTAEDAGLPEPGLAAPQPATRTVPRPRHWLGWLVALVALALLAAGGWFGYQRWFGPAAAPGDVASVKGLYEPPLAVGAAGYQFADEVPVKVFKGETNCIPKLNAAVAPASQAVVAGSDRGWGAYTWRFPDRASAQKAYESLRTAVDGCTVTDYTLGTPVASTRAEQRWTQYTQKSADGTDHGRIVLTSDANTVTWLEGGRDDMGDTTFQAIRARLAEMD